LTQAVLDPGFTPRARDLDALVDMLGDDALVKAAERALGRLGGDAVEGLRQRFLGSTPPLRARVLRAIGRFPDNPEARTLLIEALGDPDPKTRRNAAMALGHVKDESAEAALLSAWESDPRPEMRRTVAASLGKVGGPRAVGLLDQASRADDAELARIAGKAALMVGRTASRAERGRVDDSRASSQPLEVVLLARDGLEELLAQELLDVPTVSDVHVTGPGHVRARIAGPLRSLFGARTMLSFAFPLPTEWSADGETLEEVVARAVTSDAARAVFGTFTHGAVRYRLAWDDGSHRRARTWSAVQAIGRRAPELVNDPTASLWEVVVAETRRFVDVSLAPRGLSDPRFEWRLGDVPAASHPTIAAALARVAGVREGDVVWDPFVGSGSELVERARLGPWRSLHGSDVEPRALQVARGNLDAAGLKEATLEPGDALTLRPPGVTLVITNPPMGRRASRARGLADALDRFVEHVASVLAVGGRLVWITPWAARARAAADRSGLSLEWARAIDMGGFDAEMQRFVRVR
jgi:23S rRNA G2445 N2-methylase RlmL